MANITEKASDNLYDLYPLCLDFSKLIAYYVAYYRIHTIVGLRMGARHLHGNRGGRSLPQSAQTWPIRTGVQVTEERLMHSQKTKTDQQTGNS